MKAERITRRAVCAAGLFSAGCGAVAGAYFGKNDPPTEQRLIYIIGSEPNTLDPAMGPGGTEMYVTTAMFEGLTNYHPGTGRPMAALATHYEVTTDHRQFTFYLRGHPRPRGIKLANTDTLRMEYEAGVLREDFSRGHRAPPDHLPACWSDGTTITAHDFVYSWRRVVDPATGALLGAFYFHYLKNAQEVSGGKLDPRLLGVRALDDFTFQVDTREPTPFFLEMTPHRVFAPVPRHAIAAARAAGDENAWTEPGKIVTGGAFTLQEHRPYDRIVLRRNPAYYESGLVALRSITFLPITDGTTSANLYKVGDAHSMEGYRLPPLLAAAIKRKKDVYVGPAFYHIHPELNTKRPPFDNVLLRYALNMATQKERIAQVFGSERGAARTFVPPAPGYEPPHRVMVTAGDKPYDVLAYDPEGARELLDRAGFPNGADRHGRPLVMEYVFPQLPHSLPIAEILQQQWRRNLNITLKLVRLDFKAWNDKVATRDFDLIESGGGGEYVDPSFYLELFQAGGIASGSWSDPKYDAMLTEANATRDPTLRMSRLSACETRLLRAMPIMPLLFYRYAYLQKPYVRGLASNPLDVHPFKYAWIDTEWKPQSM